jgi:hypothetical protein
MADLAKTNKDFSPVSGMGMIDSGVSGKFLISIADQEADVATDSNGSRGGYGGAGSAIVYAVPEFVWEVLVHNPSEGRHSLCP